MVAFRELIELPLAVSYLVKNCKQCLPIMLVIIPEYQAVLGAKLALLVDVAATLSLSTTRWNY